MIKSHNNNNFRSFEFFALFFPDAQAVILIHNGENVCPRNEIKKRVKNTILKLN